MEQNHFSNFGGGSFKDFEIGPLAYEYMLLKGFSIFSSGSHFVQPSGIILSIFGRGSLRFL